MLHSKHKGIIVQPYALPLQVLFMFIHFFVNTDRKHAEADAMV